MTKFLRLLEEDRGCRICEDDLPCGVWPVLQVSLGCRC